MNVITLLNEKGGVGKTTLSIMVAAWFALKGRRVLLIDADPQGSATRVLGFERAPGLYDLVVRGAAWNDVWMGVSPEIYDMPEAPARGRLMLLPGNTETRAIANQIANSFEIMERLEEIQSSFDYIVFDTSPTPSLLHGAIYLATTGIIYPTECEFDSFQGLQDSLARRVMADEQRQKFNLEKIKMIGIVPMKFRAQTLEHRENLDELRSAYGKMVMPPLSQRTVYPEATRVNRVVWNYEGGGAATTEAITLMEALQGVIENVFA